MKAETAQVTYAAMMKGTIVPALRDMGFRGSAPHFSLDLDQHFAMLTFQRSLFSDAKTVRLVVEAGIVGKEAWAAHRREWNARPGVTHPAPERPNAQYLGGVGRRERLGRLMRGRDHWWQIGAGSLPSQVAAEVVDGVRNFALPFFDLYVAGAIAPTGMWWSPEEAKLLPKRYA